MKKLFSIFLSIYSWCDALADLAARHTTVCLDYFFSITCIGNQAIARFFKGVEW